MWVELFYFYKEFGFPKMLSTGLPKFLIFGPPLSASPAWVVSCFEKSSFFDARTSPHPASLGGRPEAILLLRPR